MSPIEIVQTLIAAIESRDLRRIAAALSPDARWQNVPHEAATGRGRVIAMLAPIVTWSDRVAWEIVTIATDERHVIAERVDRFWINGEEHAVRCNGVFEVDPERAIVTAVRDYVDLVEWRGRITPVYDRMSKRSPLAVVGRHLAAVDRREVASMAADYALDATLTRGGDELTGWFEIADYFDSVPARLTGRSLEFADVAEHPDGTVTVRWTITDGAAESASGTDTYLVANGRIVAQSVALATDDF